jgi:hypothetical protein
VGSSLSRKNQAKMKMNPSLIRRNLKSDSVHSACLLPMDTSLQWTGLMQPIQILLLMSLPLVLVMFNLLLCNIPISSLQSLELLSDSCVLLSFMLKHSNTSSVCVGYSTFSLVSYA